MFWKIIIVFILKLDFNKCWSHLPGWGSAGIVRASKGCCKVHQVGVVAGQRDQASHNIFFLMWMHRQIWIAWCVLPDGPGWQVGSKVLTGDGREKVAEDCAWIIFCENSTFTFTFTLGLLPEVEWRGRKLQGSSWMSSSPSWSAAEQTREKGGGCRRLNQLLQRARKAKVPWRAIIIIVSGQVKESTHLASMS